MRCHYLSDLHLEAQDFEHRLPAGDVLIIAGDLCNARCLAAPSADRYSSEQRDRVLGFIDRAVANFTDVLLVAGNHEHYDGLYEETDGLLRRLLPGVTVLNNDFVEIGGVRFFGSTFWTDFNDGNVSTMSGLRRKIGEYFFVKTRTGADTIGIRKFQPEDALREHHIARRSLRQMLDADRQTPTVVVTHHAPSHLGLNPLAGTSELNPAYASSLDDEIADFNNIHVWVHGHTHIARQYRIGKTMVCSNAYGFAAKGRAVPQFSAAASFDLR